MGLRTPWPWVPSALDRMLDARAGLVLDPLRAEVFGVARFEEHGRHLGASHDAGKAPFGRTTFYPRLQSNIRALRAAYRYLFDAPHDEHAISPAAEWLFDNFHLIESQLKEIRAGLPPRYYRSLPVLKDAPLVGLPRVCGVAWSFVAHTDSAFDESLLVHYLDAYQQTRELSQGELWALPTTLRVVLVENLRRLAERLASHKAAQELASLCAARSKDLNVLTLDAACAAMEQRGVAPVFLAHLAQSMMGRGVVGGQAAAGTPTPVQQWLLTAVPDLVALQAQQQINQAADQLSMGNAVTALRRVGAADWSDIISQTSLVLRAMLQSPVFAAEDESTRNTTLHGIENLSARSGQGEAAVAQALLVLMSGADGESPDHPGAAQALAGYWLQGAGRSQLEHALGARRHATDAVALWRSAVGLSRVPLYLGALLLGSLGLLAWLMAPLWGVQAGPDTSTAHFAGLALVAVLLLLPVSEIVVAVVNRLIAESVRPIYMPRYLLPAGIPVSARVLVAIGACRGRRQGARPYRRQCHNVLQPSRWGALCALRAHPELVWRAGVKNLDRSDPMTMTEADMSHATAWPSWFQAASPFFLALPLAERRPAPEGPSRPSRSAALTPMVLAPGVPQERHGGASGSACASAGIALQDWDLLFRAVLETLGRTAGDSIPPDAVDRGVQSPGDVLAECLQALEHLRRSVPLCDAAGCADGGHMGCA